MYPNDNVSVLRKGPPTTHPLDEYVVPLLDYTPQDSGQSSQHIICDRWHVGERVYPQLWNRQTRMDDEVWRYVEMFLMSRGALSIRMVRNIDDHKRCLDVRGDGHGVTSSQLDHLIASYTSAYHQSMMHWTAVTSLANQYNVSYAVMAGRYNERIASITNGITTYVGAPDATIMLIGDVRGDVLGDDHKSMRNFPAFGPYPATSGHFLLKSLIAADADFSDIAFMNACDVDDPHYAVHLLGPTSVVALGRNAARRLDKLKIDHGTVQHPQFVRRFHSKRYVEYGAAILRAANSQGDECSWLM